ncbi:MAG TPA: patatin-like protein, partial [Blastocatellia bacterium]
MSTDNHLDAQSKTREMRLGLVMYGGVSLAVYINGVAAEFFRAVRGRGVYRLIKALTDSDIVVDIISGTSAGGINGILLAYALCNNKDFLSSATLWRRDGDIRSLLRSPHRDKDGFSSLLNSEGYYQPRLEEAFRYMRDYVPEDGEMGSEFCELDLFVTGTDVDGNISTQFDDAGHAIDVKDHRSVFLLKHRKNRKEPFNPQFKADGAGEQNADTTYKALAKLARITSCFPAAFTPVYVTAGESNEDKILQAWGQLDKDSCFLDGGVIDNKPFTYTLKEIFERSATRQVDRKLYYVEPDPEHFSRIESASNPNIYEAVIASLIGIPGYESIADDLKLLATHNSKLNQFKRLTRSLNGSEQYEVSPAQQQIYENSRLIAISERVVQGILKENGKVTRVSQRDRKTATALVSAFDGMVEEAADQRNALASAKSVLDNFDVYFRLRRLYRIVYLIADQLYNKKNPVQGEKQVRYKRLWRDFNRQIKLLEILRVRMEDLIDQAPIQWRKTIEDRLDKDEQASLTPEVTKMWGIVSLAMRNFLNVTGQMAEILPQAYPEPAGAAEWLGQDTLSEMNRCLKECVAREIIDEISRNPDSPKLHEPEVNNNLLFLTDSYEAQILEWIIGDDSDPVVKAYRNFQTLDMLLYPMEMIAGLHEKDIIQTIRISPADAEKGFSSKSLADKVSGDALYHFGGFFKRSWRSNDILWGRLDSCCQLIESLLDRDRIKDLTDSPGQRKKLRDYFGGESQDGQAISWSNSMDPATLFHQSGEPTHIALRRWIENLLSDDESKRALALDKDEFKNHISWLVEAAQLEIIKEELQYVITDALGEQAQWNQFRVPKLELEPIADGDADKYAGPFVFSPIKGHLDPFVSVVAAAGQAQSVLAKLTDEPNAKPPRPTKTKLGQFFMTDYNIGTEALLKDMPSLILLEILSVSLLVLRNCVLGVFGERAEKIKRNPLYLFTVDYPLRAFNALVLLIRRAPMSWKVLLAVFFFLSLIALAIGIAWRDTIIYEGNDFKLRWFVVFIAAPILILFSQGLFLWRGRVHKVGLPRVARDIIMSLLLLSPLVLLAVAYREITLVYEYIPQHIPGGAEEVEKFQKEISSRLANAALFGGLFFIIALPFFKITMRQYVKARRQKAKELKYALEDFFDFENFKLIADRLDIPPTVLPRGPLPAKMTPKDRTEMKQKMAAAIVNWAKNEKRLSDLEREMRAINPEPLYY